MLRQKKEKLSKVKVCFAGMSIHTKEYNSRSKAQASAQRLSKQYSKWNYFVVEKETV